MPADDLNDLDLAQPLPGSDEAQEEQPEQEEVEATQAEVEATQEADTEDKAVPPGVQKRLDKMTFNWREEQRKREAAERQLADIQAKVNNLESRSEKTLEDTFKKEYEQTRSALAKAVEDGDTEAQVAHMERIADMRARAIRLSERKAIQERQQQQPAPAQGGPAEQAAPPLAMDWYRKNSWFNAPGQEAKTLAARSIDVQLESEGYDMHSPDYYKVLDERLQNWEGGSYNANRNPGPAPVAPAQKQAPVNAKGGRPRLTRDQLAMAQEIGLTTEEELKAYAEEIGRSS